MKGRISVRISARRRGPGWWQPGLTPRFAAMEVFPERFSEDPAPAIPGAQLLRTLPQGPEEVGNPPQGCGHCLPAPMMRGHRQPGLAGMPGLTSNPVQEQRPAGDRLAVVVGIGEAVSAPKST